MESVFKTKLRVTVCQWRTNKNDLTLIGDSVIETTYLPQERNVLILTGRKEIQKYYFYYFPP